MNSTLNSLNKHARQVAIALTVYVEAPIDLSFTPTGTKYWSKCSWPSMALLNVPVTVTTSLCVLFCLFKED